MEELTKALNNGCFYMTLKWGESLYLNCCPVQSVEKIEWNGADGLELTTEKGKYFAVMFERYWQIEKPTAADLYEWCVTVKYHRGM